MEWNRGRTTIGVPVLSMRSSLADFEEPEPFQDPRDLPRFEDWDVAHLRDLDGLRSDELTFQLRLAVLEEHRDDLL